MGLRLGKSLLNVGAKNQLANAERQVASRRPGTLSTENLERLPTSNMIAASEMMKERNAEIVNSVYDPELGKNLGMLTGTIHQHSDFVLPKRAETEYIDNLPRIETRVMGEILAFARDEFYSKECTIPSSAVVAEKFGVDETVASDLLRYNGLAQTVDRVDEGEKIILGLWPYDRPLAVVGSN